MRKKNLVQLLTVLLVVLACVLPSQQVYAAKVAINRTSAIVYVSNSVNLKVSGTTKKVTWSTSNSKVAAVSKKGVVTGKKAGTATITAKVNRKKYICKIIVKNPYLSSKSATIYAGSTKTLSMRGATVAKWTSSNSKVATVSKKGVVTAKAVGSTTIKVTCTNKKSYSCKVTVKKPYINSTSVTLYEGCTKTLSMTGTVVVKWTTSKRAVATVSSKGVVTARAAGSTTIKAVCKDKKTYSCKVTVKKPYISSTTAAIHIGSTYALKLTGATVKSWSSSNTYIATVTSRGLITGKAAGTATVTVTDTKNRQYSVKVTVIGHNYQYEYEDYGLVAAGVRYKKCFCGETLPKEYLLSVPKQEEFVQSHFPGYRRQRQTIEDIFRQTQQLQ